MERIEGLNGYICLYNGRKVEIWAKSSYAAQQLAAKELKVSPKREYLISVNLCERADGSTVVHTPDF